MPTPLRIAAQVTVNAEPEPVWRAAVDWPRQREWIWGTRVSGGHGAGAEVTGWTGIGPIGFTDPMVITHWDPPQRCEVLHLGSVVRGEGGFEVLAAGAGARVVWWESVELPLGPVGRAGWRLSERMVHMGLELSLARLRRLAEGEAG